MSAELIIQIDTLMSSLEPDGLVVAVALIEQGYAMSEISAELIEDQTIQSFEAGCFVDARSQAAHALFEDYWPDC